MPRHAQNQPRRRVTIIATGIAAAAFGALVTVASMSGASPDATGGQTCTFHVSGDVVDPSIVCAPDTPTTEPPSSTPPTTTPPTTVPPTTTSVPTTPPPTKTSPPPANGFPDATNTGVPTGTILTAYAGSHTLAAGTIVGKTMSGDFTVTGDVTIQDSKITGSITNKQNAGTLTLTDDEIIGSNTDETNSVIFGPNITAHRINVHGGKANFQCQDGGCNIYDSYFHAPYFVSPYHYDVIGSNGVNSMVVEHNTLQCQFSNGQGPGAGGCSADLGFFGDFAPIQNVTVSDNLFMAATDSGYCVITNANKTGKSFAQGKNLVWTDNTFQRGGNGKCGYYGPVDEWSSGNGNQWSGNHWDDGTALTR